MNDEKPLNNPFAALDKKRFRPASGKKGIRITPAPKEMPPAPVEADSEEALFLDAVRSATPLEGARKAGKSKAEGASEDKNSLKRLEVPSLRTIRKAASLRNSLSASDAGNKNQGSQEPSKASLPPQKKNFKVIEPTQANSIIPGIASGDSVEDEALAFASAMRDVEPLHGKGREVPSETPPPPLPPVSTSNPLQDFLEGKLEFTLASTDEYVEGHVLGLDLLIVGKLQAGQFSPEAHLDLHGLNASQAFQTLVGFIKGAYLKGQRTVLVVPGRGLNSPSGMGVLREKVQNWFTQEPFRRVVLAFCTARPTDGGAGALYVLLRKFRKDRGKVYWERRPADPDLL